MLNKLMNKILGGTVNTTENQVAAQVTAEPVEHTASSTGEQKQPRRRTTTRRPAGEGRTNHDGESTNRPRRNANNRTNTNGGSTATRRTNTRRNAESGEGTERKPRQTRAPRGEHGENTRNTRTNRTRNGQNQNRSERTNRSANRNNHHDQGEQIELIGRTPNGANKGKFQIIPLGGLGEIGKNMTVFQYEDEIIVLDSGLAFPSEDMLGVDIVIPDMSYIIENKDRVKAVVITHGHEDHIGSLAYLMKEISCPVYATNLVCGLIEGKFKEHKVSPKCLRTIAAGDEVQIGQVKVGFIQTNHSIPDSCAVYFDTPIGTVLHTGDFKIDQTPVDGRLMDMHKFAELGNKGVLALLSDSTNVEKPGTTGSESSVGPAIKQAVGEAKGRVVLATFASNVSRIQQAIDAAVFYKRKVVIMGRSMVNVTEIAQERGYLNVPPNTIIDVDVMHNYTDDQIMILTTGSQGEPMAGLSRMATSNHRTVELAPNDTVIISATPIPGNEGAVGRTIDNLLRLGCNVVYGKDRGIHVSGHASQEELKTMLNLVRPEYFIPVHGEYRMLRRHGELGVAMGVDPKKVLIGDNGQIFEFDKNGGRKGGRVQAGAIFVDGLGVGDVGNIVIRDRQQLAQEGMVIVVMAMDKASGTIVAGPDLVSRGFVYVRDAEELMLAAERRVDQVLEDCELQRIKDWTTIKQNVRDALGKFFYDKTRRRPMILPIIQDV
ncbi:RNase J family beta-CASP ribonuclease [Veillonella denticariosi JCM 15641]|uniref:Ribonuclease J n=2 Tax=Veillonella denticariosi TaxID=419208 RepID=A0A2S7ZAW0_9FIRM|nr:RNase J family beta-CASP ribonuclease [Veillonella denticariosi JCM 15641]